MFRCIDSKAVLVEIHHTGRSRKVQRCGHRKRGGLSGLAGPRETGPTVSNNLRYEELRSRVDDLGWSKDDYQSRFEELITLVPCLKSPAQRYPPRLLLDLLGSPESVASNLIALKQLFPSADVFRILLARPKLLLDEEFAGAQVAAEKLNQIFPDTDIGTLVERAPLLLVEDVDQIVQELRRLFPANAELTPQELYMAPHLILSVQRGTKALGPGAEF